MRRKYGNYFEQLQGAPAAISFTVNRRVSFSEVDVMGIVWHGRYALYFEEASQELGRRCGLGYQDFYTAKLRAPIVQFHIDYFSPLQLDEEFTVRASAPWCEGAKLLLEFEIRKKDGSLAAAAYTVQMFTEGDSGETLLICPDLLEKMRARWRAGEFACLK